MHQKSRVAQFGKYLLDRQPKILVAFEMHGVVPRIRNRTRSGTGILSRFRRIHADFARLVVAVDGAVYGGARSGAANRPRGDRRHSGPERAGLGGFRVVPLLDRPALGRANTSS